MRQVIYQFNWDYNPEGLIENLKRRSSEDKMDFNFVNLIDILTEQRLKEATFSPHIGHFVGRNLVEGSHAIIWAPHVSDSKDWFEKLTLEGYQGKKILIHTGFLGNGIHMKDLFGKYATHEMEIPTRHGADKIYRFLTD